MRNSIPLGRIAGVQITCSWFVVFIAFLYTFSLSTATLPSLLAGHAELSGTAFWIAGFCGALLFFASLLAHEMGHALMAKREGVGVTGIELWLLGGLARFENSPQTAGAELRISAIGPLTSATVGGLLLLASHLVHGSGTALLASYLLGWLGWLNLALAAFNILPASPLDGGGVLSALVWMHTGSEARGTAIAARSGQIIGVVVGGAGLLILMNTGNEVGIWLAFVGWFIASSATAQLRRAPLLQAVQGVHVGDVMFRLPAAVPDWLPLDQFLRGLDQNTPYLAFPVTNASGQLSGLLTAAAVRATNPQYFAQLRVGDLAFPLSAVITVSTGDTLLSAVQRLQGKPSQDALVAAPDGRIVGVVGADVLRQVIEARQQRQYVP